MKSFVDSFVDSFGMHRAALHVVTSPQTSIDVLHTQLLRAFPGTMCGVVIGSGASADIVAVETPGASWVAKVGKTPAHHSAFHREACVLRAVASANVPRLVGGVRLLDDGRPVLLMSRCEGHPVSTVHVGARAASLLTSNLLEVLASLHALGWVHRDVKPSNVLFETYDGRVSLVDFGEAREIGEPRPNEKSVGGTPEYMSPEELQGGPAQPEADIYAAGALLYELLCGHRVFRRRTMSDLLLDKSAEAFQLLSDHDGVPVSAMDDLTSRMLCADPAERPSIEACVQALLMFQLTGVDWTTAARSLDDRSTTRRGFAC